jgi:hypothetical protein
LGWASLRIRLNIILTFGRGQGNEENTHDKRATYANSKGGTVKGFTMYFQL